MSTTTTATALFTSPSTSTSSFLATPSSSNGHRVVRFDNQCILIPDNRPKRPKMVTKSYSLPLWKKKPELLQDTNDREDTHVTFKVPVPSFMTKARSPSRGRGAEPPQPLSSCLVNSDATASHPHRQLTRRPSLSLPPRHKGTTVPLRACCPDCVHATEECLKEGELWQEKFSRGAHRRRSASLDTGSAAPLPALPSTSGFAAVVTSSFPELFTLTVDEVDKRRRSLDFTGAEATALRGHSTESPSSSGSTVDDQTCMPPRKSPIPEEDEDQLFPLPSPRRSPSASPSISPRASPIPTPNASTSSLGTTPPATAKQSKPAPKPATTESAPSGKPRPGAREPTAAPVPPRTRSPTPPAAVPVLTIPAPSTRAAADTPPPSPRSPEVGKRRLSFSVPGPGAILKAGAGALRGVNSMGSMNGVMTG